MKVTLIVFLMLLILSSTAEAMVPLGSAINDGWWWPVGDGDPMGSGRTKIAKGFELSEDSNLSSLFLTVDLGSNFLDYHFPPATPLEDKEVSSQVQLVKGIQSPFGPIPNGNNLILIEDPDPDDYILFSNTYRLREERTRIELYNLDYRMPAGQYWITMDYGRLDEYELGLQHAPEPATILLLATGLPFLLIKRKVS